MVVELADGEAQLEPEGGIIRFANERALIFDAVYDAATDPLADADGVEAFFDEVR